MHAHVAIVKCNLTLFTLWLVNELYSHRRHDRILRFLLPKSMIFPCFHMISADSTFSRRVAAFDWDTQFAPPNGDIVFCLISIEKQSAISTCQQSQLVVRIEYAIFPKVKWWLNRSNVFRFLFALCFLSLPVVFVSFPPQLFSRFVWSGLDTRIFRCLFLPTDVNALWRMAQSAQSM